MSTHLIQPWKISYGMPKSHNFCPQNKVHLILMVSDRANYHQTFLFMKRKSIGVFETFGFLKWFFDKCQQNQILHFSTCGIRHKANMKVLHYKETSNSFEKKKYPPCNLP